MRLIFLVLLRFENGCFRVSVVLSRVRAAAYCHTMATFAAEMSNVKILWPLCGQKGCDTVATPYGHGQLLQPH